MICVCFGVFVFLNETATTENYTYLHTLSLHDALPIFCNISSGSNPRASTVGCALSHRLCSVSRWSSEKPSKSQGVAIRVRLSGGESTADATDMVTPRQ